MRLPRTVIFNSAAGSVVSSYLQHLMSHFTKVISWTSETFPGMAKLEAADAALSQADFAVFVFAPGDSIRSRNRSHQLNIVGNLMFEVGYGQASLGRRRTVLLTPESATRLPSDLDGTIILPYGAHTDELQLHFELARCTDRFRRLVETVGLRNPAPAAAVGPTRPSSESSFSCFISYARHDEAFAASLANDLSLAGVNCWRDAQDIRAGAYWQDEIRRAINASDKMLITLSGASLNSRAVGIEVAKAIDLEAARGTSVLYPIRLDDSIFTASESAWTGLLLGRQVADFTGWQDKDNYRRAFARLYRDLITTTSLERPGS